MTPDRDNTVSLRTIAKPVVDAACAAGDLALTNLHRRRRAELPSATIERVLVLHAEKGLGNLVLLTPLLANLRRRYPESSITVALPHTPLASAVLGPSLADDLLFFRYPTSGRPPLLRFAWQTLRPRRFQLGLATFFAPTLLASAALAVAGCRYRIAYATDPRRGLLNTQTLRGPSGHEVDRHLRLLNWGTAPQEMERRPTIRVASAARSAAREFLARHGLGTRRALIGIHPGCDRINLAKRWPIERFQETIRSLVGSGRADVLVFLGPDDGDLLPALAPLASDRVALVTEQPLERVIALVAECSAFVSNDSGLMHVAAAVEVPVVAIFGPTGTDKNAPLGAASIVTAPDVACRPCHVASPIVCRYPRRHCLEDIPVARIVAAVSDLLDAPAATSARRASASA